MINPAQIPDEVVEALIAALHGEPGLPYRKALAAALAAWPGMLKRPVGSYYAIVIAAHLVLPLPDEGAPTRGDACND